MDRWAPAGTFQIFCKPPAHKNRNFVTSAKDRADVLDNLVGDSICCHPTFFGEAARGKCPRFSSSGNLCTLQSFDVI